LLVSHPNNAEIQYYYATGLLAKIATSKDETLNKELRIKARNALIKSSELGNKAPIVKALIASIPEDGGTSVPFSKQGEAEGATPNRLLRRATWTKPWQIIKRRSNSTLRFTKRRFTAAMCSCTKMILRKPKYGIRRRSRSILIARRLTVIPPLR